MTILTRSSLLRDAHYFAGEPIRRLKALQRREPNAALRLAWGQAASLARRIRRELQAARIRDQHAAAADQQLQESRR